MEPWGVWFDCHSGINALTALARLINKTPDIKDQLDAPNAVVAELDAITKYLAVGERIGSKFRLEMG